MDDGRTLWSVDVPHFRGMNILTPAVHGDSILTSSYKNGTYLFQVRREADAFVVSQLWKNKATGYMSSPVIIDGHAYLHLGNRRIDCIDLATGESRWRSKPFGEYWSMIAQGDRILALDADGSLHLVQADTGAFEKLDSRSIADQETWGHLAIQGRGIFVRELGAISVWDWN
jgi:outer membrane protein assembly factor BamB